MFGCDTPDDVVGLNISYPFSDSLISIPDDPIVYWVPLEQPIPEPVSAILVQMRNPHMK